MSYQFHPIAPTSDPERAKQEAERGPKTYVDSDFSDAEDSLPWWRALTLFGAVLVAQALLIWWVLTSPGSGGSSLTAGTGMAAVIIIGLGGLAVAALGFGAEAIALFAGSLVGAALLIVLLMSGNPGGVPTLGVDRIILVCTVAVGVLMCAVGVVAMARVYRALSREEKAGPVGQAG